jgi:hypothetical protein
VVALQALQLVELLEGTIWISDDILSHHFAIPHAIIASVSQNTTAAERKMANIVFKNVLLVQDASRPHLAVATWYVPACC